jgi:thiamine pyrophosphate-dependent acetolactate synthase large subunit-like protein
MRGDTLAAKAVNYYLDWHVEKILSAKQITYHRHPLPFEYPKHSKRQVQSFCNYLKKSKKPVMVIGSQVILSHEDVASGRLTEALINLGIPIYTSGMARGLLGNNPLAMKHNRKETLRDADLVVLVSVLFFFLLCFVFLFSFLSHVHRLVLLLISA